MRGARLHDVVLDYAQGYIYLVINVLQAYFAIHFGQNVVCVFSLQRTAATDAGTGRRLQRDKDVTRQYTYRLRTYM